MEPTEFGLLVLEKAEAIFLAQEEILEATQNAKYIGTVLLNQAMAAGYLAGSSAIQAALLAAALHDCLSAG